MSSCNELCEFGMHLAQSMGAPPRVLMPIARRFRRLATTHQRRCVVQCNGCRTCHGIGEVVSTPSGIIRVENPKLHFGCRPCPTCSLDAVEAAIEATCAELTALRDKSGVADHFDMRQFVPYFQHDPRGATVRLRLPSQGDRPASEGLPVPTSGRF